VPTFGVFLGPDPLLAGRFDPRALAPYSYALNNPLLFADGSGWEGQPYFHPGFTMIVSGGLTIAGVVIFGTFAAVPATAIGAVVLAVEAVGVSVAGVEVVLGFMSFLGSRDDAQALSDAIGMAPSSVMQFAALPLALSKGTNQGYADVMETAEALEVLTGAITMKPDEAGEQLYNMAAFGATQFMERKEAHEDHVGHEGGLHEHDFHESIGSGGGGDGGGAVSIGDGGGDDHGTVELIDRDGNSSGPIDLGPPEVIHGDPREPSSPEPHDDGDDDDGGDDDGPPIIQG
jgi:hypothetical protein